MAIVESFGSQNYGPEGAVEEEGGIKAPYNHIFFKIHLDASDMHPG